MKIADSFYIFFVTLHYVTLHYGLTVYPHIRVFFSYHSFFLCKEGMFVISLWCGSVTACIYALCNLNRL